MSFGLTNKGKELVHLTLSHQGIPTENFQTRIQVLLAVWGSK